MLKKIVLLIFLFPAFLFAQKSDNYSGLLRSKPWKGNNAFLYDYLQKFPALDSGKIYYRVPISIHIFLNPRENIQVLNRDIKRVMLFLNKIYADNHTGMQFYLSDIQYYKIQKHLKTNYFIEAFFIGKKDKNKNSINVYYVNVLEKKVIRKQKYYKGVYNSLTNSIILIRHSSKTTLAHEIGHYFGLLHPHRNYNRGKLFEEPVDRTRKSRFGNKILCQRRGDFLSDTPAEPELTKYTDKDCNYTGNLRDAWGDEYHPNTNNIMSYPADKDCRTSFTRQQKAVMLYTLNQHKSTELWQVNEKNMIYSFDAFEPDNVMSMCTLLLPDKQQYHTFHYVKTMDSEIALDSTDCFFAYGNFRKHLALQIDKGKNEFPHLFVLIQDDKGHVLLQKNIDNQQIIDLGELQGRFFISLQAKAPQNAGLMDYFITLKIIAP